jgi:integrase
MYGDGQGLWLEVRPGADGPVRSWIFRYRFGGKARYCGLGSATPGRDNSVSLAEARDKAFLAAKDVRAGIDPIEQKRAAVAAKKGDASRILTFDQCAAAYISSHEIAWRNRKHRSQWRTTIATYASPVIGSLPVNAVDTNLILRILQPMWMEKTQTASRLRARIENVLDYAKVRELRAGENPARWRGHLAKLLPAPKKVQKVRHHPALPFEDLPAFMQALKQRQGITAKALMFGILAGGRTDEILGARWDEFELETDSVWTIPAERMKSGREHRVPVTEPMRRILAAMADCRRSEFVFPGATGPRLHSSALDGVLIRMGSEFTVHGFRSTFRTWAADKAQFPRELAEVALAHLVGDDTERAYQRGDQLMKRRKLMEAWSAFATKPPATGGVVVTMPKRGVA